MNHDRILSQLSEYLDGTLSATGRETVETHLAACPGCQRQLRELQKIQRVLKSQPVLQPPDSFYAGVRARINARPARRGLFSWNSGMKLAATVCTLIGVVLVTREIRKENPELSRLAVVNEERQSMKKEIPLPVEHFAPEPPAAQVYKENATAQSISAGPMAEPAGRLQSAPAFPPARSQEPQLAGRPMGVVAGSYGRDDGAGIGQPAAATVPDGGAVMKQALPKPGLMFVIRSAAQWKALWQNAVPPTAVNFEESMVVAVYNTGNQTAKLLRTVATPTILTVEYQVTPGIPSVDMLVSYLVIPKTDLPIQFKPILR